jgi:putative endonuclease
MDSGGTRVTVQRSISGRYPRRDEPLFTGGAFVFVLWMRGVVVMHGNADPGRIGERIAADYLMLRGCRIIRRNYRCGHLEVDLIADDGGCLVFVEVKTRTNDAFGEAIDSVGDRKLAKIRKAARFFLSRYCGTIVYGEIRFDLIAIDLQAGHDTMILRHVRGIR